MTGIEARVTARVLDALLREDYAGLRAQVADGRLLLPTGQAVRLEPRSPSLLASQTVSPGQPLHLAGLFAALRLLADPRDDLAALEHECQAEVTALTLQESAHAAVLAKLATADPLGPGTYYDTLAAFNHHPVHPTSQARPGLTEEQLRTYAPEFHPTFELRWAAVPRVIATITGRLPGWWPTPADVGLSADAALFPVHPLTPVPTAPRPYLQVTPTLSMRTVSVVADPAVHLKVPLPTSTLGLRNRRSIVPRTLADGAVVQRLLGGLLAGHPVLLADEQTYGHTGDPMLGYLVRRYPAATHRAHVLPVAALLTAAPHGGLVIERLADDVETFFDRYLQALFSLSVPLFTRHGIALETHQQNLSLTLTGDGDLRLLIKDNDGPLLHPRLPGTAELADRRLVSDDPEALARVFVTITLHLCAGAIAFGLAERELLPLHTGLALVRDRLDEALTVEGAAGAFLRSRTLDADRLPAKAMVTAGTLVDKSRTGATDINKHYGPPGPNYLRGIRS